MIKIIFNTTKILWYIIWRDWQTSLSLSFLHSHRSCQSRQSRLRQKIYKSKQGKLFFQPIMSISAPKGPFHHGNKQVANCKTSGTICVFYLLKKLHQIQVAIGHAPGGGMKLLCGLQGSLALLWASRTQNFKDYGLHPSMPLGLRQVGRAMLISQWGHGRSPCAHGSQLRHFPFPSS